MTLPPDTRDHYFDTSIHPSLLQLGNSSNLPHTFVRHASVSHNSLNKLSNPSPSSSLPFWILFSAWFCSDHTGLSSFSHVVDASECLPFLPPPPWTTPTRCVSVQLHLLLLVSLSPSFSPARSPSIMATSECAGTWTSLACFHYFIYAAPSSWVAFSSFFLSWWSFQV